MKKLILLPIIFCLYSIAVIAQPSFIFPTLTVTGGDQFCVQVGTENFTSLLKIEKTFEWDSSVIEYKNVNILTYIPGVQGFDSNVNLTFDESETVNGRLAMNWVETTGASYTIDKQDEVGYVLFEICYEAIGTFGKSTVLGTADFPQPCVTRLGSGGLNIGCETVNGLIGTDVLPVRICPVEDPEPNQGDFFCVDFAVENFRKIVGFQMTVEYDPTVLEFDGISDPGNLTNFNPRSDFVIVEPGKITGSWFARNGNLTLDNGTPIFSVCFRAIGDCRDFSFVKITSGLTPIQVYSGEDPDPTAGTNIGFVVKDALVRLKQCDPSGDIKLTAECPEALPGEIVTIDVTAEGFQSIVESDFLIKWNSSVLEFRDITMLGAFMPNEDRNAAPIGTLKLTYKQFPPTGPGVTLPNGAKIFRLEFLVIGDGTVSSSVSFPTSTATFIKKGSNSNAGLVASNGCVLVKAPPGLTLSSNSVEGFNGDQVCIDVTAANFEGINFTQFTINYNNSFLQFDAPSNFALSSMNASNITDLGGGNLGLTWDANMSGFGESLPDGTILFTLCFTIIGNPSPTPIPNCAFIQFTGDPQEIIITSETSGTFNIGLNSNDGNVCILDPGFFTVSASENSGCLGEIVCIDVTVENCNEITSFQFSTSWNTEPWDPVVKFDDLVFPGTIPNFDKSNFDLSNADLGIITMLWNDGTGDGVTLPEGTVIFSACFEIIGNASNCTNFSFQQNPLDIIVTSTFSNGNNIGLNSNDGELCATDYLRIQDSTITNVGCPGSNSGSVFLRVAGGIEPYFYDWNGTTQTTEDITNLPVGNYSVEITDSANPAKKINASFNIDLSGAAPIADAGLDRNIPCNGQPVILDGTLSSAGNDIAYRWFTTDTGILIEPSDRTSEATVGAEGTYVLEVLDTETNCVSYDTVMVIPPDAQPVDAGQDKSITCFEREVNLDGSAPGGANARFFWRPLNGGLLDPLTDSTATGVAITPGDFELIVRDIFTGCEGRDTVKVIANTVPPAVDAGPGMALPCMVDTITIGGSGTATGSQYTFEWTEINGGNIVSGFEERAAQVNSIGLYRLEVTDTLTGCFSRDSVEVIGDPDTPLADAGIDLKLNCTELCVEIQSQSSSQNGPYGYQWEAIGGGQLAAGEEFILQPTVCEPGRYLLTVTNLLTQCQSFSSVNVISDLTPPNAKAGADIDIGCLVVDIPVDGLGSSFGSEYDYQWTTNGSGIISTPDSLITSLNGAGEYILEVTNTINNCVAYDTMNIFQDTTMFKPIINIDHSTAEINCRFDIVTLNALGSDNGADYEVVWGPAANIVNGQGTLTPSVNAATTYTLSILHDSTQCTSTAQVEVTSDTISPIITVPNDEVELPCDPAQVIVASSLQSTVPDITFQWYSPGGGSIQNPNSAQTTVFDLGTYFVYATDQSNGCNSDTLSVNVIPAPSGVISDAGPDLFIDCDVLSHDITGGNSSTEPGLTYSWIDADTGGEVSSSIDWTVEDAGTFVLLIMDANGCQAVDTMVVMADSDIPEVNAGINQSFTCFFEDAELEGSFDAMGANNVDFTWTSLEGNPIADPNSLNTTVTAAGTYVLTVINRDNNCTQTDTMVVTVSGTNLEGATASFDNGMCENFATITGNLPTDATGMWMSLDGGVIDDPTNPMTTANDLPNGVSTFVWTLSTADCPNYSFDTISINITGSAGSLSLRNDLVRLPNTQDSILIEYLLNDDVDANGNWDIEIIEQPTSGQITNEDDGSFLFTKEEGSSGTVQVTYSVCNIDCMDQCDTALIRITIEADEIILPTEVPNAITPNDDGVNDALIFEILEVLPDEYPNNELLVFNRWGNVVHKSKPYLNDWKGTGRNGKTLPHGTYYYILRLNISEGMIVRGDVTILK